jgi:predicted DNA-binding protein YlxM (UPF0122 family)
MIRACSYLKAHRGALVFAGLAVISMAFLPQPASAQWQTSGSNIYYNNGNVGVGTPNPDQKLTVQGGVAIRDNGGADGGQTLYVANTTPSGVNYGAVVLAVGSGASYNTGGYFNASGASTNNFGVRVVGPAAASGNYGIYVDATAQNYFAGNVGIGTTNPQYLLSVNGQIGAKDVIVTNSGWSDYVFQPGYRLRPLSEVNAYIQANHHLPDIPSEAEVSEKGVSVNDMQKKLLAKVEELTLHMIQQEKDNQDLRAHVAEQEKQNQELRDRLARLEKSAAAEPTRAVAK